MRDLAERRRLEAAIERIEGSILPAASTMLDALLDSASLARPGVDADIHAAEIRALAERADELALQMAQISPGAAGYLAASAA